MIWCDVASLGHNELIDICCMFGLCNIIVCQYYLNLLNAIKASIGSGNCLMLNRMTSHYLNQWWPIIWRKQISPILSVWIWFPCRHELFKHENQTFRVPAFLQVHLSMVSPWSLASLMCGLYWNIPWTYSSLALHCHQYSTMIFDVFLLLQICVRIVIELSIWCEFCLSPC